MSRQNNCRNKSDTWPYLCAWHLNDGLWSRIKKDDKDCWHWTGWFGGTRPQLFLGVQGEKKLTGQANHLLWWQRHGVRIMKPEMLVNTCATLNCLNPDHMRRSGYKHRRHWSMREVVKLREEFWGTETVAGNRSRAVSAHSADLLAANYFRVSKTTMQDFRLGKASRLKRWPDEGLTREFVQQIYDEKVREAERNARHKSQALSFQRMADREGTTLSVVQAMLGGQTYKTAGGPTAPVRQSAHKLRIA